MFDNTGRKIKVMAKILAWIGIILSVIGGGALMFLFDGELVFIGVAIMIVGSLVSWVSSWFLYGYGEIIENTYLMVSLAWGQHRQGEPSASQATTNAPMPPQPSQEKRKVKALELHAQGLITDDEFNKIMMS